MPYAFSPIGKTFPNASVINTTAPTFAGITSASPNLDSTFTISWTQATGLAVQPIRYAVYVALGASVAPATLFQDQNVAKIVTAIGTTKVFMLADGSTYFVRGQAYTFGVRAISHNGIAETNTATQTATATASGNLPDVYQIVLAGLQDVQGDLEQDHLNFLDDSQGFQEQIDQLEVAVTGFDQSLTVLDSELGELAVAVTGLQASDQSLEASAVSLADSAVAFEAAVATVTSLATAGDLQGELLDDEEFVGTVFTDAD
jgi:hypothetical protein